MSSALHRLLARLRSLLHRVRISHVDDGTDDFSLHPHRKRRLAQISQHEAMRGSRTVSAEDRILERGANPRTGMVSPFTPAAIGGDDYIGDLVPIAGKRKFGGVARATRRCNSDGRWRQNSYGWNVVPPTPDLDPLLEVDLQSVDDGHVRTSHVQSLQGRFLVRMPGVDDPAPKNMSDAKVHEYQCATSVVEKVSEREAAVLVTEGIDSKRTRSSGSSSSPSTIRSNKVLRKSVGSGPKTPTRTTSRTLPGVVSGVEGQNPAESSVYHELPNVSRTTPPSSGSPPKTSRPTIRRQACAPNVPQVQQQARKWESTVPQQVSVGQHTPTISANHRLTSQHHPECLYPTISTAPQSTPPENRDANRTESSANHTETDASIPNRKASETVSRSRPSAAQTIHVNRANVNLEPHSDVECMVSGIHFASEPWFEGHWADAGHDSNNNNDDEDTKDDMTPSLVPRPIESHVDEQRSSSSSTTTSSSTWFLAFIGAATAHLFTTLLRAPTALRILRTEDSARVRPKAYRKALQDVGVAGVTLLVGWRAAVLVADTMQMLGWMLRWGWVGLAVVGVEVVRWRSGSRGCCAGS